MFIHENDCMNAVEKDQFTNLTADERIKRTTSTLDGSNERYYAYLVWYFLPSLQAFIQERRQTFYGYHRNYYHHLVQLISLSICNSSYSKI